MLYRIDFETYLTHAIDHFPMSDLIRFQYVIISAGVNSTKRDDGIRNSGDDTNVVKHNELYLNYDLNQLWAEYSDVDMIRKHYKEILDTKKDIIHNVFINLVLNHHDVIIVCRRKENPIIDILIEYIDETFSLQCIDLNKLFMEGSISAIYIDRDEIKDNAVDLRRQMERQIQHYDSMSHRGRVYTFENMTKKEKIKKLKEIGISVNEYDDVDLLLLEGWVNNPEFDVHLG